jgi:hypothetical protein
MNTSVRAAATASVWFLTVAVSTHAAWGQGADVGPPGSSHPLQPIGRHMRDAQQRIANKDTSQPTQTLQQQVVDDLTELIRQLEKKCGGGPCQGQPKTSSSAPKKPSQGPAKDSVAQLNQQATRPSMIEETRQLNRKAWGHLPPVLREGVTNAGFERFLPKYEKLIERYFSRLAEEPNDRP